jgi:hypothetical protein
MLDDLQRREVIEESNSPCSSPVIFVRKKNGELRFCVNYRKLNDVTKKEFFHYPGLTTPWTRWRKPDGSPHWT